MIDAALYDPDHGFYASGGRAGRRGDFITSPEVGPLFGALVARLIDREWERLGKPDEFTFIEMGAGPGTLARSVLHAEPRCASALRYVTVERATSQRSLHADIAGVTAVAELPEPVGHGLVFANELLDNVAFTPLERVGGVTHVVDVGESGGDLVGVRGARIDTTAALAANSTFDQRHAAEVVDAARSTIAAGRVVFIDYARADSSAVEVRTYRGHERGVDPLERLGEQDVTIDIDIEQLQNRVGAATHISDQASWLADLGMGELVAEGARIWQERAHIGDLAALKARSRVNEAEALREADGLGGFTVFEWAI